MWGDEASVDDPVMYRESRLHVLSLKHYDSVSLIDAETDKEYKARGGTFSFAPGDTFIPGLHQRTKNLVAEWQRKGIPLSEKTPHTEEAVEEMLLRLKWDDRVPGAKEKLARIVEFLWKAYLRIGPQVSDIPSSLL